MSDEEPLTTSKASQGLLTRLLAFWVGFRRIILIAILSTALTLFLNSLTDENRRALLRGLWANQELVALLFTFSLLVLSLLWSAGQKLDAWVFLLLNLRVHHPLWLDRVMWALTQIGNGLVGIFGAILLYFANLRRLALELLLGMLSLWLMVEVVKALIERRRPFLVLEGTRIVGWREIGLSFPSGHTAQSFFMATLLSQYLQAGVTGNLLLYGTAVLVGFTRIYVGAHYPRDVLGGAILGSVWGILSVLVQSYFSAGGF